MLKCHQSNILAHLIYIDRVPEKPCCLSYVRHLMMLDIKELNVICTSINDKTLRKKPLSENCM